VVAVVGDGECFTIIEGPALQPYLDRIETGEERRRPRDAGDDGEAGDAPRPAPMDVA